MMAKKIHQPARDVTNVKAPPALEHAVVSLRAFLCHLKSMTHNYELPSSRSSHCVCRILVREGQVPVCSRQASESADESKEDEEEGDVGTDGADEEDEADESYASCVGQFHLQYGESLGSNTPIKTKKKAKLALKPGCCSPSGFPGFPSCPAICVGEVT